MDCFIPERTGACFGTFNPPKLDRIWLWDPERAALGCKACSCSVGAVFHFEMRNRLNLFLNRCLLPDAK